MLNLDDFLDLKTETGVLLRDFRLISGHYLVWKLPIEDGPVIALPTSFKNRAIKNIVAIKGFVIHASAPFRPLKAIRYWEWDMAQDPPTEMPKYRIKTMPEVGPSVLPGECVLYNSFNVALINVIGLSEPLAVVRDCDLLAAWDSDYDDQVEITDEALKHVKQKAPQ